MVSWSDAINKIVTEIKTLEGRIAELEDQHERDQLTIEILQKDIKSQN